MACVPCSAFFSALDDILFSRGRFASRPSLSKVSTKALLHDEVTCKGTDPEICSMVFPVEDQPICTCGEPEVCLCSESTAEVEMSEDHLQLNTEVASSADSVDNVSSSTDSQTALTNKNCQPVSSVSSVLAGPFLTPPRSPRSPRRDETLCACTEPDSTSISSSAAPIVQGQATSMAEQVEDDDFDPNALADAASQDNVSQEGSDVHESWKLEVAADHNFRVTRRGSDVHETWKLEMAADNADIDPLLFEPAQDMEGSSTAATVQEGDICTCSDPDVCICNSMVLEEAVCTCNDPDVCICNSMVEDSIALAEQFESVCNCADPDVCICSECTTDLASYTSSVELATSIDGM